ncbi:MAG: hypothetical protein ACON4U_02875 [Myxococcota bacterium]
MCGIISAYSEIFAVGEEGQHGARQLWGSGLILLPPGAPPLGMAFTQRKPASLHLSMTSFAARVTKLCANNAEQGKFLYQTVLSLGSCLVIHLNQPPFLIFA